MQKQYIVLEQVTVYMEKSVIGSLTKINATQIKALKNEKQPFTSFKENINDCLSELQAWKGFLKQEKHLLIIKDKIDICALKLLLAT